MTSTIGQPRADDAATRMLGIMFMCAGWLVFSGIDASSKYLISYLAVMQVVFLRYAGGLIYSFVLIVARGVRAPFKTAAPLVQFLRGVLLVSSTALNFLALRYLQLDQTSAIMFSIPLIVCALSVPLLGENVGWRRWLAVVVGLLGVMIVIRPGFASFHWAMLLSVLNAILAALYMILTRKVAAYDKDETSLMYTGLIGTALTMPFGLAEWQPLTQATIVPALLIGLFGGLGHHFIIIAHRLAPAPVIAPFGYTHIIWMILLGYFLFDQLPDAFTLIGASIIIASGLFLFVREQQLKRPAD